MSPHPVDDPPKAKSSGTLPATAGKADVSGEAAQPTPAPRRRIVFIEPNPILRDALVRLFDDHALTDKLDVVTQAALSFPGYSPGMVSVLAFDPEEVGSDLGATVAEMREVLGDVALVAYTGTDSMEIARRCVQLGFRGVLPRTMDSRLLARALTVVAEGGAYLDRRFGAALMPEEPSPDESGIEAILSKRERAVLEQVARGVNHKAIAQELGIGHKTVDTYKARAMRKLGISGRENLLKFALSVGWLQ
jgi:DNA-binding NarL/FixJ family response regulator